MAQPAANRSSRPVVADDADRSELEAAGADTAAGHPLAEAVFAAGGVARIYGVNDFVTVTRQPGFAWDPIVAAVVAAAATDL